jgi:hypothetical protein
MSFTSWRKANASSTFPARCPECGGLSYVSGWAHAATAFIAELMLWGTVVLSLVVRSWWLLLVLPLVIFLWSLLVGVTFSLRPIEGVAVQKARRNAAFHFGILAVVAIIGGVLSATST